MLERENEKLKNDAEALRGELVEKKADMADLIAAEQSTVDDLRVPVDLMKYSLCLDYFPSRCCLLILGAYTSLLLPFLFLLLLDPLSHGTYPYL